MAGPCPRKKAHELMISSRLSSFLSGPDCFGVVAAGHFIGGQNGRAGDGDRHQRAVLAREHVALQDPESRFL